jgi:hypothetical protein
MGVDPVALARAELRAGMPAIEKLADKQAFAVRLKELAGVETPRLGRSEARLKKTGASFSGVAFKARGPQEWLDEVEGIAERSSDLGRSVRRAKGAPQSLKNKIEGVGDIRVQMEILFARIQKETTRIAEEADGASAGLARQQRSLRDMTREMEALYNKTIGIARSIAGRSEVRDIEDLMLSLGISKDEEVANVLFWIMMGKMNQGAGKVDPAISELVGKFNVDQEWTERERSRSLELIRKNSQYIPAEMFSSEDATLPYAEWAVQPAQTADLSGMSDASRSEARLAQIPGEAKGSSARSENRSVDGPASGGEVRGNKPRHEETGYLEGRVRFEGGLQLAYTGLKWDVSRNGKFLRRFSVNHPEFKEISVQPGFGIFILFNNAALFVGDDGALEKIDLKYGFDKLYMNEGVGCAIETSHEVVFVSLKGKVSSHKLEGQLWVTPASVLKVLPGMGFLVGGNGHVYLINKDGKERFDPYKMGKLYNWAEELDESSAFIEGVGWVGVFEHGVVIISADGTAKIMKYQKESLVLTRLQARRGVGFLMEFQREYWFIDQSLQVFKSSSKDELIKEHPEVSTFY